ncbi:Myocardin-related transcription factor B [Frankliniella fusca]|uniref:Myocardin-related transcription factor B n=1 Tax=Frankliniella fusca TaxID=407009 RepID=A0AAE1HRE9_9NEOP|nr:Myocardin-related transcription factor B [Frankliniella fusca]
MEIVDLSRVDEVCDLIASDVISQCNHPNFDLDIMDPVLLPDDVPGAKLDLDNLDNYNVEQLKWWLACRGLPQKGRKPDLKERILNHRQRESKIYPGVGKGKWYEAKRNKVMEGLSLQQEDGATGCCLGPLLKGHFDPRPSALQKDDDPERIRKFVDQLQSLPTPLLWSYHLLHPHPSTTLDEEEMLPDVSTTLTVAEMSSYMLWNLNLIRGTSMSRQPLHLPLTRHQSSSPVWVFERAVRIPASTAKKILGLESSRSTVSGKINYHRKHIWGLEPFQNQVMKEGLEKEPAARIAYTAEIKKTHPEWDVNETGTWVSPKHPQLSCSPDGLVVDVNGFVKLLEVKCPAVLRGMDPSDFETLPKE